jgi:hypothetical protein
MSVSKVMEPHLVGTFHSCERALNTEHALAQSAMLYATMPIMSAMTSPLAVLRPVLISKPHEKVNLLPDCVVRSGTGQDTATESTRFHSGAV